MKIVFITLLVSPLYLLSQVLTGYNSGSVIKNNGDTLYGLVKLRNKFPYKLYSNIQFNEKENTEPTSFTPEEIKGFLIGTETYESKYISAKNDKRGFYQLKIRGLLSYFEMENYGGAGSVSSYQVLLHKDGDDKDFIYDAGNMFFPFKRKLSEYLKEYPELSGKIKHNIYNPTHIEKIVNEYNLFFEPWSKPD
jgi:hypothetical protein